MKNRILGHLVVAAGAACVLGAVVSACSLPHNDQSLFIRGILAPPIVEVGSQCTYTADPTLPEIGNGILDVALSQTYTAQILVGNQLVPQSNPGQSIAESNRIAIQGATVSITGSSLPGGSVPAYTYLTTGFVDPSTGTDPSYGLVQVEIVNNQAALAAVSGLSVGCPQTHLIIANVRVYGQTLGAQYVESNQIQFPISVCNGCLVSFPTGSDDPTQPGKNCDGALASASSSASIIQPCVIGQDQAVDCRLCNGNNACNPADVSTTCP